MPSFILNIRFKALTTDRDTIVTIDITNICKDLHRIVLEALKGGEAEGHPSRINLRYRAVYLSNLGRTRSCWPDPERS